MVRSLDAWITTVPRGARAQTAQDAIRRPPRAVRAADRGERYRRPKPRSCLARLWPAPAGTGLAAGPFVERKTAKRTDRPRKCAQRTYWVVMLLDINRIYGRVPPLSTTPKPPTDMAVNLTRCSSHSMLLAPRRDPSRSAAIPRRPH